MALAKKEELLHACEETAAIAAEFASDRPEEVEMPLAEMFGVEHLALTAFLEEFVDDLIHGTLQAMKEGKLPQETSVLGRQMMAVMVRGLAMGVVLERERHFDVGPGSIPLLNDDERGSLMWALENGASTLRTEAKAFREPATNNLAILTKTREKLEELLGL